MLRGLASTALAAALLFVHGTSGAAAPSATTVASSSDTVVHAGFLLVDPRQPVLRERSIVVRGGRIESIRPGFVEVPGARTIDLRQAFVLPGLIDLHVHLTTTPAPGGDLRTVAASDADLALLAADNARRTLAAGFTTVLDLGTGRRAHEEAIYALRRAIDANLAVGPRILAVGSPLSAPGSSRTGRYRAEVEAVVGPEAVCTGADGCREAVREQVRRGADVISFYNTGSLLSIPSPPQTFTDAEMNAIVETASALRRPAIADGGNTRGDPRGIHAALRAGVSIIDTVTYASADTWKLARERGAFFVPHLYALEAAVGDTPETLEQGTMGWLPRPVLEYLYALKQETPSAVEARRAGVQFAFGSDPGVFPHGHNAREFVEYVRVVGLSPAEAIATATVNAARALGRENEIGRIATGLSADLVATRGNPLEDVSELTRVVFVMRAGHAHFVDSGTGTLLPRPAP
jgi:imidazolonepropionase-like amidohydrolase